MVINETPCYIKQVPREIIIEIMVFLEEADLFLFNCVCRFWSRLCHDEAIKKKVYLADIQRLNLSQQISNLLYLRSYITLYPGIEKHLDFYHCLARAIKRSHHPAVLYFLAKANLDISEFATLIDLLADYWHSGIFMGLIKKYFLLFRQHWHICLFEKLRKEDYEPCLIDFPKPIASQRGYKCINRFPYSEDKHSLTGGYKEFLKGKKSADFIEEETKKFSLEIRALIYNL